MCRLVVQCLSLLFSVLIYGIHADKLGQVTNLTIEGGTAKHCIDQYMFLFRYSSLRGDTAIPGGLHARLCHAFLVSICFALSLKPDSLCTHSTLYLCLQFISLPPASITSAVIDSPLSLSTSLSLLLFYSPRSKPTFSANSSHSPTTDLSSPKD